MKGGLLFLQLAQIMRDEMKCVFFLRNRKQFPSFVFLLGLPCCGIAVIGDIAAWRNAGEKTSGGRQRQLISWLLRISGWV